MRRVRFPTLNMVGAARPAYSAGCTAPCAEEGFPMKEYGPLRAFGGIALIAASIALGYGLVGNKALGIGGTRSILSQVAGLLAIMSGFSVLWSP